jgi:hypothetical protein
MSSTPSTLARAAGLAYLIMAVASGFWYGSWLSFRTAGDGALLGHLRDGRFIFELSLAAGTFGFIAYLVAAALLLRRYGAEAGFAAGLLFAFVVASAPLSMAAVGKQLELLPLLDATGPSAENAQAQVAAILRGFDALMQLSTLFWGLWLFPLGWLAWRSGGLSRVAGAFLTLSGAGYLLGFILPLLKTAVTVPPPVGTAIAAAVVLGELVAIVWLLLGGGRAPKTAA